MRTKSKQYAILDSNGTVTGFAQWDGVSSWPLPAGVTVAEVGPGAALGAAYANGKYTAPAPAAPTVPQQAQAALRAGLPIVSTSTPALNGTYSCGAEMQSDLVAELQFYGKFGTFPNKASNLVLVDMAGNPHQFTSAQAETLYEALGNYRSALKYCILGASTTLPDPATYGAIT